MSLEASPRSNIACKPRRAVTTIADMHDDILLHVFKFLHPLPHLFSVARTCTRFRQLTGDRRTWLCVVPNPTPQEATLQNSYPTLETALAAARPGDTIWLSPRHHVVSDVVVRFPVHLRGGGSSPEETRLTVPKGVETGLDFRATCLLANVSIRSDLTPCIVHRMGHLRLERCKLTCMAHGLEHLVSPIVTVASSSAPGDARGAGASDGPVGPGQDAVRPLPLPLPLLSVPAAVTAVSNSGSAPTSSKACMDLASRLAQPARTPAGAGGNDNRTNAMRTLANAAAGGRATQRLPGKQALALPCTVPTLSPPQRLLAGCGIGRLVVCETQLSGGGQGVRCWGSGALQGVRAIYGPSSLPFFFFEVDSRYPGEVAGRPLTVHGNATPAPSSHLAGEPKPGAPHALKVAGVDGLRLAAQWRAGKAVQAPAHTDDGYASSSASPSFGLPPLLYCEDGDNEQPLL